VGPFPFLFASLLGLGLGEKSKRPERSLAGFLGVKGEEFKIGFCWGGSGSVSVSASGSGIDVGCGVGDNISTVVFFLFLDKFKSTGCDWLWDWRRFVDLREYVCSIEEGGDINSTRDLSSIP
jgi:hypothetical protein